jgi:hypothetical protein
MSNEVLSNTDLARKVISMGGTEVLATSKSVRHAHAPCAQHYERWRQAGCRATSDEQRACLNQIGLDSALCQGEYSSVAIVDGWPVASSNVAATTIAQRVQQLLTEQRPYVTTVVTIAWRAGSVTLQSAASKTLSVRRGAFGRVRCRLTDAQCAQTMHALLTTVGRVQLPPPANEVVLPRSFEVRVVRSHDLTQNEWLLLTAERM